MTDLSARIPSRLVHAALVLMAMAGVTPAHAQQLEPRAFAPNPAGANFVITSVIHTEGSVMLDPSVPIEDFRVNLNTGAVGYGHSFSLGSRLASVAIVVPYAHGDASGIVNGGPRQTVHRSAFGDTALRLTMSLLPGSALDPATFMRKAPDRTLGASLLISMPTGQYMEERLVNVGANRWAFKPELGGSRQFGRWSVDGSIGAWFFTDNHEFLGTSTREQDPMLTLQGHVSYTFRPGMWLGASLTWYEGGRSTLDGVSKDDRQRNSRAGLTFSLPLVKRQSVKLAWSTGTSTRIGGDFDLFSLTWQYLWFD